MPTSGETPNLNLGTKTGAKIGGGQALAAPAAGDAWLKHRALTAPGLETWKFNRRSALLHAPTHRVGPPAMGRLVPSIRLCFPLGAPKLSFVARAFSARGFVFRKNILLWGLTG